MRHRRSFYLAPPPKQIMTTGPKKVAESRESDDITFFLRSFDTVTAFVDYCAKAETDMPVETRSSHRDEKYDDWSGARSFDAALALAREGWPEGREEVETFRVHFADKLSGLILKPEAVRDVTGLHFDVGNVVTGIPECWFDTRESTEILDSPRAKIIRVQVSGCVSGMIDGEVIRRRGAAVTALVDALESTGRRCEVMLDLTSGIEATSIETRILVKQADEPVQIDQLAFFLMHPCILRRFGFCSWELAPRQMRASLGIYHGGGYGRVRSGGRDYPADIHLDGAVFGPEWSSNAGALKWITTWLSHFGVTLTQDETA